MTLDHTLGRRLHQRARRSIALVLAATSGGVGALVPFASGEPAGAASCELTWKGGTQSGADLGDPANWGGTAPSTTSVVCFPDGVQVTSTGVTFTVGEVQVPPTSSLTISGGTLDLTSTSISSVGGVFLPGSTLVILAGVTVPAGRSGLSSDTTGGAVTILRSTTPVPSSFPTPTLAIDGRVEGFASLTTNVDAVNRGIVRPQADGKVVVGALRTFTNDTGGTVDLVQRGSFVSGTALTTSRPRVVNGGLVRLGGITANGSRTNATVSIGSVLLFTNLATGTVEVVAGDVAADGAITSTGTVQIGNDASDASCTNPTELAPTGSAAAPRLHLRVTNHGFNGGQVTGPGCLSVVPNASASVGTGVPLDVGAIGIVSGSLSAAGDRTLPAVRFGGTGRLSVTGGTATMTEGIGEIAPGQSMQLSGNGTILVPEGQAIVKEVGVTAGTVQLSSFVRLVLQGSADIPVTLNVNDFATFRNESDDLRLSSFVSVAGAATFTNIGRIVLDAPTGVPMISGAGRIDNAGTIRADEGSWIMSSPLQQLAGDALTGGRLEVADGVSLFGVPAVRDLSGEIRLEGSAQLLSSPFGAATPTPALAGLSSISALGVLELADGADLDLTGSLTNHGTLALSSTSQLELQDYAQGADGTYIAQVGATSASSIRGVLVDLDGGLVVVPVDPAQGPVVGAPVLNHCCPAGTFATVLADPGAATVTYQQFETLVDYDPAPAPPPLLTPIVATTTATVLEGTDPTPGAVSTRQIAVTVTNPNEIAVPVTWSIAGLVDGDVGAPGQASTGEVSLLTTSSVLTPGPNIVLLTVLVAADSTVEPDETFTIVPTPGAPPVTVTIVDDDIVLPPVLQFESDTSSFAEGGGGGTISVTRDSSVDELRVAVTVVDVGTSADDRDVVADPDTGELVFPAGERTAVLSVSITDDDVDEPDETFEIRLGPDAAAPLATHTVTIVDDDDPPPDPIRNDQFVATLSSFGPYSESAEEVGLVLLVDRTFEQDLVFEVVTLEGTATPGEDYVELARTITVPAGATGPGSAVLVDLLPDLNAFEADREFFAVALLRDGEVLSVADIEIVDDDAGPQARFVRQPVDPPTTTLVRRVVEGTLQDTTLPLQIELVGDPIDQPTTVTITAQSTEAASDEFSLSPTEVVFLPGETTKTVVLTVVADGEPEPDERILVGMSSEFGDGIGRIDDTAVVTIVDDDADINLAASARATVEESAGSVRVEARVTSSSIDEFEALGSSILVPFTIQSGTADAPGDVEAIAGTITIPAGVFIGSIAIPIADDTIAENDETFTIEFGTPTNGRFVELTGDVLADTVLQVTILDDDPLPFDLSIDDVSVTEGESVTLELAVAPNQVSADPDGTFAIPVRFQSVTASFATDWVGGVVRDGRLVDRGEIAVPLAGGTVELTAITLDDSRYDGDETFEIVVGREGVPGEQVTAVVTILDDDPFPEVIVSTAGPYEEDVEEVGVTVRLSPPAASTVVIDIATVDGTAEAGADYVALDTTVVVGPGASFAPPIRLQLIPDDDAYEFDREFFVVEARRSPTADDPFGEIVGATAVEIVDDDLGSQARFVRGPGDSQQGPLRRDVIEGTIQDTTVVLPIELLGDPRTSPMSVFVVAQPDPDAAPDPDEFSLEAEEIVFEVDETTGSVRLTIAADDQLEEGERIVVGIASEFGESLGRVDDVAVITIVNDDAEVLLDPTVFPQVSEDGGALAVVRMEVVAATMRAFEFLGSSVTVPYTITAGTAELGSDLDVSGLTGVLTIPAGSDGRAEFTIPIVADDVYEGDETFVVTFGDPAGATILGETEFTVTILDDDPLPFDLAVTDATVTEGGIAELTLSVTPTGPVPPGSGLVVIPVTSTDITATRGIDWVPDIITTGSVLVSAAGGTRTVRTYTIADSAFDGTETFQLAFGRSGQPGEQVVSTVTILDDDPFPTVTVTTASPYSEAAPSIAALVRLDRPTGTPLTFRVRTVDGTATAGGDYTAVDTLVTVPSGSSFAPPIPITLLPDADASEPAEETFTIEVRETAGAESLLASTEVRIMDDDLPGDPGTAQEVAQFATGWDALGLRLGEWLAQFDLDPDGDGLGGTPGAAPGSGPGEPFELPAVVGPNLNERFDLRSLTGQPGAPLALPALDQGNRTLGDLCLDLQVLGADVLFTAGGVCGAPVAPAGELVRAAYEVTLADLATAAGVNADPFHDATEGVLRSLADTLALDTVDGQWVGDLTVSLLIGVDSAGFYVARGTELRLQVGGTLDLSGSGVVAGVDTTVEGSAGAAVTVALGTPVTKVRDLSTLLDPTVTGIADAQLGVVAGPLDLTWSAGWTMADGATTPGPQTLTGSLVVPGLTGGTGGALDVIGTLDGDRWDLVLDATLGADAALGGFGIASLDVSATVGPDQVNGSGTLSLVAPLPDGDRPIDVSVGFDEGAVSFAGGVDLDDLDIGTSPVLLRLVDPFVGVGFDATLPAGPLVGGLELGAARAIVLPADPAADATDVLGSLGTDGTVELSAATVVAEIADGAVIADLTDVAFTTGRATGPNLFTASAASGRFPALDDLAVTFTDLFLTKQGGFGAASVEVASGGLAESIGLGGILPFDVTSVTATFPDPSDLDTFTVAVDGRFDFTQLPGGTDPDGLRFRLGLGGPVVDATSPPEDNSFTFSVDVVSLADGIVRPLDVGPLTVGFDGLVLGDYEVGADIELAGFVGGELQPGVGGQVRIDGPVGSLLDLATIDVAGALTVAPDGTTTLDVDGSLLVDAGTLGPLSVEGLLVQAGVRISNGPGGFDVEARLDDLAVDAVSLDLGEIVTLSATDVDLDLVPAPGGNVFEVGDEGGLAVQFGDSVEELEFFAGWGGSASNVAIGADLVPRLLPGFRIDVTVPSDLDIGLPDFLPLFIDEVGITFPDALTDPDGSIELDGPGVLAGLRLRIGGGLNATETWPIAASVGGLEVDLGELFAGRFPITNLDGLTFGVEPFDLGGGTTIGGGLTLGTIDVDGQTVFYGRVFGEFSVAGIGGGADLVVTQYGPVLMKVRAPLGIPLGPTGLVLAAAEGAAQFGDVRIPVPPVGDPQALLTAFTLPTDLTITDDVIRDAVRPTVAAGVFTWDQGFAMSIAGELTVAAAPGVLNGRATLGFNVGSGAQGDPAGLQLVGKGEVVVYGIPLGEAGVLIDLADPLAPSYDFAFASPGASPLAVVFPAQATFGVQLRTDGVVLGTIEGIRAFAESLAAGAPGVAEQYFAVVLDEVAAGLDADRTRPLAVAVLDLDGDGTVSASESSRTITAEFVLDRLTGAGGVPSLLPAADEVLAPDAFERAALAATAVLDELLRTGARVLEDPDAFGSFALDASDALAALDQVIRDATADALAAFGDRFDPSFAMSGALQPTFLGLALGSPILGGELLIDRTGLFFEAEGSLTEIGRAATSAIFPPAGPAINATMTAATLGLTDRIEIGARLPVGGVVDTLLTGGELPQFQPLDPNWAVTFTGQLDVLGYEGAELSGIAFLPGQESFLESRVEKVWELGPNDPIRDDRIPVNTPEQFATLVEYGGILVTASLRVPRLVTDPASQLASFPPAPEDPLDYLDWLQDVADTATETDTPARIQYFLPGITSVSPTLEGLTAWAEQVRVEGVWDGQVLGLDLGRGRLAITPAGLELTGAVDLIGLEGSVILNSALLDGGTRLPSAGLDVAIDTTGITNALADLGLPAVLIPPVGATGRLRAFTPGFDPDSTEPIQRNGGIELEAQLGTSGLTGTTTFRFGVSPNGGGFDVRGSAAASQIGPIAGVTITDASIDVEVVDGVTAVRIGGDADVLGARATASGSLGADLTGTIQFDLATDEGLALAGLDVDGQVVLTLTRVNGVLRGSLGVVGTATLPAWLATASGRVTVTVAGCVDTAGNAEVLVDLPALSFGPDGLVRVGSTGLPAELPPSPAGCTPPTLTAPGSSVLAGGPTIRFRSAAGQVATVIDGTLEFTGAGSEIAGLRVNGSLDTGSGTGSMDVSFAGGSVELGGFTLRGSARATFGPGTFAMSVDGRLTVPGVITDAVVTGTADQDGIERLTVGATGMSLSPLTITGATLGLTRTGSDYRLEVGGTVSFSGIGSLTVSGNLGGDGFGSLSVTTTSVTVRGASITNGSFSFVRAPSGTTFRAGGTFSLFGTSLEVVEASLLLGVGGTISGNLTVRPPGGAALTLGGWSFGGTLRLVFSGVTSQLTIDNGSVAIPGWGSVGVTAQIAIPATNGAFFQLALPAGGLRLGGASSPFFATGTFRLAFTNNVATLSASNPSLSWRDGATTIAAFAAPSVTIASNGSVSASSSSFAATLGSFSFTVPSLSLLIDTQGANARLALGAGAVTFPGFPAITTQAFTIQTATTFSLTLVSREVDLGFVDLNATLVFERQGGVFRLRMDGLSSSQSPFVEIEGLVNVPVPAFTVASNGTFLVTASVPAFGPSTFQIQNASFRLEKTGTALSTLAGQLIGGALVVGTAAPITLPTLSFGPTTRFDQTFTINGWALGPFLRTSSTQIRVQHAATGGFRLDVVNDPSVTAFSGSSGLVLTSLSATSGGSFSGSITGRLALFGRTLGTATYDLTRVGNVFRLTLPASRPANLNVGFLTAAMSGTASSDGSFSFSGSTSVSLGITGFSFSGTTRLTVSSSGGISGSYSGRVCIGFCAVTTGTLRSDGRINGMLRIDIDGNGTLEVNAAWFVYLATGGVRVDINRDGDFADLGDIVFGTATNDDTTLPAMTTPSNLTVNADVPPTGSARVYYTPPTATDSGITLTVTCSPASGNLFPVGTTTVSCAATDRADNTRTRSFTVTVVSTQVTFLTPIVNPGDSLAVSGDGFLPDSLAFARLQSDPIPLGIVEVDSDGRATLEFVVPAELPPGEHTVIIEGFGAKGGLWQYVTTIVVAGPEGGQVVPDPPVSGRLPATGGGLGMLRWALMLIVSGLALISWRRRSCRRTTWTVR